MTDESNVIRPRIPAWEDAAHLRGIDSVELSKKIAETGEKIGQMTVGDVLSEEELEAMLQARQED